MTQLKSTLILLFLAASVLSIAQGNAYLTKYAGKYQMLFKGQKPTSTSDKYVFKSDGTCTWTIFTTVNPDGSLSDVPQTRNGTWNASEGLIQMSFDMDEGEGSELLTDFRLTDGVFSSEGVYLKKMVPKPPPKKK